MRPCFWLLPFATLALLVLSPTVGRLFNARVVNVREARCFNAALWLEVFPRSDDHRFRRFSQGNQDGVMRSLFDPDRIGTTNKRFVEFGFPDSAIDDSFGNGHHLITFMGFHAELLLDGSQENPEIKLHRHFLTKDNIVGLFAKYNVSKELDYLSIDIDSKDMWLFMAIAAAYRPRLVTVEYNSNWGIDDFLTIGAESQYVWKSDNIYGASLSALYLAAQRRGYTMVYATPQLDVFLVRSDLICQGTAPPLSAFEKDTRLPIHQPYFGPYRKDVIDFKHWLAQHPRA